MSHHPETIARLTDSRLANLAARIIYNGFDRYSLAFQEITRRARVRFEQRDWKGAQADATARLELYGKIAREVKQQILDLLGERVMDKLVWASMKAVYSGMITPRYDWELAETFFNSITRRIFTTVGVDPQVEFVDTDFETPPTRSKKPVYRTYEYINDTAMLVKSILGDFALRGPYRDLEGDAARAAKHIEAHLKNISALRMVERTEIVRAIFFRGNGAYIVGRMLSGSSSFPLVLALLNGPDGVYIDAVLLDENAVSILFSFTRSYFLVDIQRHYDLVRFLKQVMPRKRIAERYISIGHNQHGKTELYRDLLYYLAISDDKFTTAPGQKGMVMTVFTIPGYDVVFKVIKDRFDYPKTGNRDLVRTKYTLVFKRDRAGRLVDAQEFEYLRFDRERFSEALLRELSETASNTVEIGDDAVIVKHAYIERRMIPLDIYIREARPEAARAAILDYGNAIKDLAATNIFPGDMMLKNFGVTRHGRVVFYDYDELCLLTDCNFRVQPSPRSEDDVLAPEPWFTVNENDVFPAEFIHFLGLPEELRKIFLEHHQDLLEADYWRNVQEKIRAGEIIFTSPYHRRYRLRDE